MRSKTPVLLLAICSLFTIARSDVPPDPGFARQSVSLTLETHDDLSDYRFFISSPLRVTEIQITKGQLIFIGAEGRTGADRIGSLLAIPKKSLASLGEELDPSNSDELEKLIEERRLDGMIKLLSHNFQVTIRENERSEWKDPVYRLERNAEKNVVAVLVSSGSGDSENLDGAVLFGIYDVSGALVACPIFLALSLVALGIWLFRRSSGKV